VAEGIRTTFADALPQLAEGPFATIISTHRTNVGHPDGLNWNTNIAIAFLLASLTKSKQ